MLNELWLTKSASIPTFLQRHSFSITSATLLSVSLLVLIHRNRDLYRTLQCGTQPATACHQLILLIVFFSFRWSLAYQPNLNFPMSTHFKPTALCPCLFWFCLARRLYPSLQCIACVGQRSHVLAVCDPWRDQKERGNGRSMYS